jgi:hypothetical protein
MSAQTDLFARVRRPCTGPYGCGRRVQTLAYVQRPVCRACRRRLANLKQSAAHRTRRRWDTYDARADYWRARYHANKERAA